MRLSDLIQLPAPLSLVGDLFALTKDKTQRALNGFGLASSDGLWSDV